jgi:hypothetical protein
MRTDNELDLRLAGQMGWLALYSLAEDVADRLGLCPPEGRHQRTKVLQKWEDRLGLVNRPYSSAMDPAHELLEARSFHNAEPDAMAAVPGALAELERLILEALARLPPPRGQRLAGR